jgi:lysophospholipid acyltransferase (LPLAT)-like uncharacterized protein
VLAAARDRIVRGAVWLFALAAVALFRIADATLDLHVFGYEHLGALLRERRPILIVVWHGKGLLPVFFLQGLPLVVYSSQSRTGRIPPLSRLVRQLTLASLTHLGYHVLDAARFASESRGVIRFLQYLSGGESGVIAADGPGGPIFQAKPGAAYVARKTGVALIPVGSAMRDLLALDSWDRFEIPQPFTKAALTIGEPLFIPEDAQDEDLPALSEQLETALNDLTAQAEVEVYAEPAARRASLPSVP